MDIRTNAQAQQVLVNVLNALDQLVVSGRNNCLIVAGCSNDLEAVASYLGMRASEEMKVTEGKKVGEEKK